MTDGPATLRVATFNMRAAIGPGPFPDSWWRRVDHARLATIGRLIEALETDLVGLQEVAILAFEGAILDNASALAVQTGWEMRFAATRHFPIVEQGRQIGAGLFGNALLSRLPIRSARTVALPAAAGDAPIEPPGAQSPFAGVRYDEAPDTIREPRCLLLCEVELRDGRPLTVGSVHLSHVGSSERLLQARAVAEALGGAEGPVVLAGDLNAPIAAAELAPLRDTLTDAFAAVGIPTGDERRQTSDDGWPIDHLLVRGLMPTGCRVVREAGNVSDHWPVVTELDIGPGATLQR